MWWHTERKDLMFQTVILEILIEMALVTIQNEQPVAANLTRFCIRVKVLQPLQTKRIVCPSILRDRELPITRYICLLILYRDVNTALVDNEGGDCIPSSTNALDYCNPFTVTRLNKLRPSTSL